MENSTQQTKKAWETPQEKMQWLYQIIANVFADEIQNDNGFNQDFAYTKGNVFSNELLEDRCIQFENFLLGYAYYANKIGKNFPTVLFEYYPNLKNSITSDAQRSKENELFKEYKKNFNNWQEHSPLQIHKLFYKRLMQIIEKDANFLRFVEYNRGDALLFEKITNRQLPKNGEQREAVLNEWFGVKAVEAKTQKTFDEILPLLAKTGNKFFNRYLK